MTVYPDLYVDPPSFVPAPFGLLSVADLRDEADPHWRETILMQPERCAASSTYTDGCPPVEERAKTITAGVPTRGAQPFTIVDGFRCSPVGFTEEQINERALTALTRGEARAIERMLWTGSSDNSSDPAQPWLGNTNGAAGLPFVPPVVDVLTSAPVEIRDAIGLLEESLGWCYGGVGVLHMSRGYSGFMHHAGIMQDRTGTTLETVVGTKVAAGGGYQSGVIYATGSVLITRSGVEVVAQFRDSLDRTNNTVTIIVERTYVVTWDCCLFSAAVTPIASA